ncbi:hypothetical protein COR50_13565 [Chitinophaga caeni]|uniref:ABC transporter ATPase n=1 Tax=Chitinophaga caeni TaxID=2029983 RepID=A0A291QVV6_9BACT|nr:hypothetical protein [Chitinophaga caeni]ATL48108.1 hypothetical protein COR50_13565 [Chitinophaga caeni]
MKTNYLDILPGDFAGNSRVWIYQSNRPFMEREAIEITEQLDQFVMQWNAHGAGVKGWGKLLFNQTIILVADETETAVSGCSTDSSVRIIKSIERQYNVNMFDRLLLGFIVKDKIELLPMAQVGYALEKGYISPDTLYLDNTVLNLEDLKNKWLVPIKDSWLKDKLSISAA